ncbi:MAG: hypothetical protein FJW83_07395 [Actinobacteria bacterium]|nr:hypothetical protein [Actinomycetota bacterium]
MTTTALAWSAHPDPAHALGDAVGDLLAASARRPEVALVLIDPAGADHAGAIVRAVQQLLAPDRLAGIVAPIVLPAQVAAVVPTIAVWAVVRPSASASPGRRTTITFHEGDDTEPAPVETPDVGPTPSVQIVLPRRAGSETPRLWTVTGPAPGGLLRLEMPVRVVGLATTSGGTRGGRRTTRVPCAADTHGEPLTFTTATRRPRPPDRGVAVPVDALILRSPDRSGHHHTPASVALFPEPPEEPA